MSRAAITYSAIAFSWPKQLASVHCAGSKVVLMASVPAAGAWNSRALKGRGMPSASLMPITTSALS